MATTYKILGQITGSTSVTSSVYTVPAAKSAVVSSVILANRSSTSSTYSLAVIPSGSSLDVKNWIALGVPISGSDSTALTLGVTLATGDSIQLNGLSTGSISVFGSEIS